jgi:thiol-disulfide isomerase/thioredoxin
MKKFIILFSILILLILLINAGDNDKKNKYDKTKVTQLITALSGRVPKKTTKFFDARILNLHNKQARLSDFSGKVIMLNLWATWCPPCRAEMPSIEKLYNEYKNKDLSIIAVSQGENFDTVKNFVKGSYNFPIYIDLYNEISKYYSSGSIPTTYLIDKEGYIIAGFIGGREWNSGDVKALIDELLK